MEDATDLPQVVDRTLTLLWRRTHGEPQGARGPKQRASVDEVVRAAISVADTGGLEAFSMRRVADRLGLGVMSLYTYVPGRSELVGLMVDEVAGEVELPRHDGTLRERLQAVTRQLWDEYHRHPWLLQVESSRPWIGPHGSARYEWQLAAIEGVGLTDLEMDQVVTLLTGFAQSAARASIASTRTREVSGMSDAQWWEVNALVLERLMDVQRYPLSARVGRVAGEEYGAVSDPARSFAFGVDRILDGLETFLGRRSSGGP